MNILKKIFNASALVVLVAASAVAQDTLQRSVNPIGGRWSSSGSYTTFMSAGQPSIATYLGSDTTIWSGSVGFVPPVFEITENNPPVAVVPGLEFLVDLDLSILLEGFDPDGDSIAFEIVDQPSNGSVQLIAGTESEFNFSPADGLIPDKVYRDSLTFRVNEVNGPLSSATAKMKFKFSLGDQPHLIDTSYFAASGDDGLLTVEWTDAVVNDSYSIEINYYDLSTTTPEFKPLYKSTDLSAGLDVDGTSVSLDLSVAAADHPYIFEGDRVFVTVLITTENGNSDFGTLVIDNGAGGRTDASKDGMFFAFGSDMTVRENGTVSLNLVAVELGDFSLTGSEVEVIQGAGSGYLGQVAMTGADANTMTWQMSYTGTKEVGGLDSIQFRVYHPERQLFDTAWAKIQIKDVNDPPKITRIPDIVTDEEVDAVVALNFTDPDSEVEILVESNEASSVPVAYADGQITIAPTKDYSGLVSINVILTETGTAEEYVAFDRFDVQVRAVNDAPVLAAVSDQTLDEDNSITLVLSATDADAILPVFDYSAIVDQPGKVDLVLDGNNVTVQPRANVNGTFEVSLFADDRLGTATSKSEAETFLLTVNAVNDAPVSLKPFSTQKIIPGFPSYTIDMTAYFDDVESGADLTYSVVGNTGIALSFAGTVMSVEAADTFSGVEDVTITASDGKLSVSQQVSFVSTQQSSELTVANPVGTVTYNEDFGTATIDVSQVFTDANNASATFTYDLLGGGFINAVIDENTGEITITAPADYFGSESLYLLGTSGGQSVYTEFTVDVTAVNDAPTISAPAEQLMQEDIALQGVFVEVDDVDSDLSELSITATSSNTTLIKTENVSVIPDGDGFVMSIVPEADASGNATITLTLTDGVAQVTADVSVSVQPVNDEPQVVVNTVADVDEDVSFALDLATLFEDKEGDNLTITSSVYPSWAMISGTIISGTPLNADVGAWQIAATADDGNGGSASVSLSFDVINVNDAPEIAVELSTIKVFQESDWSYSFPESAFVDVDVDDVLTYSFESFPSWASLDGLTLTGNPQYEDIGSYEAVLKVVDQSGVSASQTVDIEVVFTVYDATVLVDQNCNVEAGELTLTASGAIDYKWYDVDDNVIQATGSVLLLEGPYSAFYYVEGVDANGYATPEKAEIAVECTILSTSELQSRIEVYPNPTSEKLIISHLMDDFTFEVFDIMGKHVKVEVLRSESGSTELDVSSLAGGVYLINYQLKGETKVLRFVKN
ncbi:MAG: Ig-like domain-containing protein [Cyclobacteriaceae bacterium]